MDKSKPMSHGGKGILTQEYDINTKMSIEKLWVSHGLLTIKFKSQGQFPDFFFYT